MSATDGWEGVARAALDAGLAVKAFGEAMGPHLRAIRDHEQAEINVEFGQWWHLVGRETGVDRGTARLIYGEGWRKAREQG